MRTALSRLPWLPRAAVCALVALAVVCGTVAATAHARPAPWRAGQASVSAAAGITSTDLAINTQGGQVFAAFRIGERIEIARTNLDGVEERRWKFKPDRDTTDIAISPRTEETVLSVDDEHLMVRRYDRDGFRNASWETGFNGLTTDLTVHEVTREVNATVVGDHVYVVMLTADGVLEEARTTVFTGTYGTLALGPRRQTYVAVENTIDLEAPGAAARFTEDGEMAGRWDLEEPPVGIASGIFDDVFVVTRSDDGSDGGVYRYMDDGRLVTDWRLGAVPTDVVVDTEGMVYVATLRSRRHMMAVTKFTPAGEWRGHWMALSRLYMPVVERAP